MAEKSSVSPAAGLGVDTMSGGAAADSFRFTAIGQSPAAGADHILDFASGDRIDLTSIDANAHMAAVQAFGWIGDAAFTAAGQLRAFDDGAGATIIEGNVNSDLTADFRLVLDNNYAVGAADFIGLL